MHILSHIFLIFVCVSQVWAAPKIAFSPQVVNFDSVAVGAQESTTLIIKNVGDDILVISGGALARKGTSAFNTTLSAASLVPGDSVVVGLTFLPKRGGTHADALILQTNLADDVFAPRPVVQVVGIGVGAEIDVVPSTLSFASQGLGAASVQNLFVSNRGNDTLQILDAFVKDVRFAVDVTSFELGPDVERIIHVTYTPDSSRARVDTLRIVSNDFDEDTLLVILDAQETPLEVGTARLSLTRLGASFPKVGDTLSVSITLTPNTASVAGVELFFGYDPTFFTPADSSAPFTRVGYSADRLTILSNGIVSTSQNLAVAHLSGLGGASDSITTEGVLTQVDLVVQAPLIKNTRLRVLVDAPLFNTQFITPSALSFTTPSSNSLGLGNTPPVVRPFPPLQMSEDTPATLALISLATDAESAPNDLQWSFHDPDSLVVVSVSLPDPALGYIARFFLPENTSGTFAVEATVTDPTGASDSSVVVVDVMSVNDAPSMPMVSSPGDSATGVASPVIFKWAASDPDRDDELKYAVRFGQNRLFLDVIAQDLSQDSHTLDTGLISNAVYFWQVTVSDASGEEVEGPIWQFTTESDLIAPLFLGGPDISDVTDSTAVVFWSLDEPASARIVLGLQPNLSDSLDVAPIVIEGQARLRTQSIAGLIPGTQYYLRIILKDIAGNSRVSNILTLTTTGEASVPTPPVILDVGDFTGDRLVDFSDFIIFAAVFNKVLGDAEYIPTADFDNNGVIGFDDFIVFVGLFGINYAVGNPTP